MTKLAISTLTGSFYTCNGGLVDEENQAGIDLENLNDYELKSAIQG